MSVKHQILILLACSLLVVKAAVGWTSEATLAANDVKNAETRAKRQELLLNLVNERVDLETKASDDDTLIESRLAATIARMNKLAKSNMVEINQTVPEGVATGAALRPVNDLVQRTTVGQPYIRLQVKGQYRSLDGLQRMTDLLAQGFVSVSKININRDTFEMDLEVYGGA